MNRDVTEQKNPKEGTILLVEDQPESIDVIKSALDNHFIVKVAIRGDLVFQILGNCHVDLILLDVIMPGMDGYEVCRKLKRSPETRDIPVIFLTGRNSQEDEAVGLEAGAVDFIRKPSSPLVVLTRSRNTITHQRTKEALRHNNFELQKALTIREDMDRLSRHDLKGPLSGILGLPELLLDDDNLTREQRFLLKQIIQSGYLMLEMINRSLDLYKMENGTYQLHVETFDLLNILERIINDLDQYSAPRGIHIVFDRGSDSNTMPPFLVVGERMLCYPLFYNIILNAIEASYDNGQIVIHLRSDQKYGTIRITNPGEVPLEIQDCFFNKYVTSGKSGGTGLGTYSAWLAAKTQGGRIALDTSRAGETTIIILLPTITS
ncbi:MAG: response regulator [Magnetococcus sp. DMHC-6]